MRIRNKKTHKKKTFNKRKPKNTVKKNKATKTKKRKIIKGGEKRKEREDECAVCYEELNNPDNPDITLSCQHIFHRNCIINTCRYMRDDCTCPLCRRVLTSEDLNTLGIVPPPSPPPPEVPYLDSIDEFREYINNKLRAPTRSPLEKLENILYDFLGTDRLPVEVFEDVAMEFELEQIGPASFHRYRFIRIIDLEDMPAPENRLNKKYFQYIDYWTAGQADDADNPEQDMIVAYEVNEV